MIWRDSNDLKPKLCKYVKICLDSWNHMKKWTNFGRILAFWIYCAPWVGAASHFSLAGEQKFLPTQLGQGWAECISLGDSTQQLTQHSSSFLALAALSSRLFRPAKAEKQRPKNTTNLFSFCQKKEEEKKNCEKYFWSSVEKFFSRQKCTVKDNHERTSEFCLVWKEKIFSWKPWGTRGTNQRVLVSLWKPFCRIF